MIARFMFTLLICTFARKPISWSSNYMFFLKLNFHSFYMALSSLVWDASAAMIHFPLENAINMCSVWTAWFQFWGKQNLLHIDVPFFCNILNVQHRIEWVHLDRLKNKNIKMPLNIIKHFVCQAAWHLKFSDTVLHSNVDFYFKFDKYIKFDTSLIRVAWLQTIKWNSWNWWLVGHMLPPTS